MMIRFKCGSTWQVVGSDNFQSLVGSPPIGIVFSEWALCDPSAWGYLRPILDENDGWAIFITTPRGRNHAHKTFDLAQNTPSWFAEIVTAKQTPVFNKESLERVLHEYKYEYGDDDGKALFDQEFFCSFDAPLVGAFYAKQITALEESGQIIDGLKAEPNTAVQTAWDLGWSDDTVIWFFQIIGKEVRVLDYYEDNNQTIEHYCNVLGQKAEEHGWMYGPQDKALHWVPWDAKPRTLASGGKSIIEQAWELGVRMRVLPNLDVLDGIQATRKLLPRCTFDKTRCAKGIEALRNYQREWDDDKKVYKRNPLHNWASHGADGMRYAALAINEYKPEPREPKPETFRGKEDMTWADVRRFTVKPKVNHPRV